MKDVAVASLKVLTNGDNEGYNVSRCRSVSINDFYEEILQVVISQTANRDMNGDIEQSVLNNRKSDRMETSIYFKKTHN